MSLRLLRNALLSIDAICITVSLAIERTRTSSDRLFTSRAQCRELPAIRVD